MRKLLLPLLCLSLLSCDRISQRVWNCSNTKLEVLKTNEPDFSLVETIPARGWIASMKGGAQITGIAVTDGKRTKVIWHQGQTIMANRSDSAEEVCQGRTSGIVVQQF